MHSATSANRNPTPQPTMISHQPCEVVITRMAKSAKHPENFVGMHFFFPVDRMQLVEVIRGEKTAGERFPGAVDTYAIEAMMQNGLALQAGTSHDLGQNFGRAFNVQFQSKEGKLEYVWQTSWGVTTRLVGALIMTHSDDKGLVLPPMVAPRKAVLVPIYRKEEERAQVLELAAKSEPAVTGALRVKAKGELLDIINQINAQLTNTRCARHE